MALRELLARDLAGVFLNPTEFAAPVSVTPLAGGSTWELAALFDDGAQETRLGAQAAGTLEEPVFLCLPEDAALLAEGDLLTGAGGETYAVVEVVRVPSGPARVRVVER